MCLSKPHLLQVSVKLVSVKLCFLCSLHFSCLYYKKGKIVSYRTEGKWVRSPDYFLMKQLKFKGKRTASVLQIGSQQLVSIIYSKGRIKIEELVILFSLISININNGVSFFAQVIVVP